jgi:hypothetical protein
MWEKAQQQGMNNDQSTRESDEPGARKHHFYATPKDQGKPLPASTMIQWTCAFSNGYWSDTYGSTVPFSKNMGGKTMVLDEVTLALLSTGAPSCHLI